MRSGARRGRRHVPCAAALTFACLTPWWPVAALAANPMGYELLTAQDAAALPHNHGTLGLRIERAEQMTDSGLTFDVLRVAGVRAGSAGALAGVRPGDEIIAADGKVFSSISVFAAYVGSITPGSPIMLDEMPAGHGPQDAQRLTVVAQAPGAPTQSTPGPRRSGLSTGAKIAIGTGAIALFGCYEMGCFTHHGASAGPQSTPPAQPARPLPPG